MRIKIIDIDQDRYEDGVVVKISAESEWIEVNEEQYKIIQFWANKHGYNIVSPIKCIEPNGQLSNNIVQEYEYYLKQKKDQQKYIEELKKKEVLRLALQAKKDKKIKLAEARKLLKEAGEL